jgi:hypothetical protein
MLLVQHVCLRETPPLVVLSHMNTEGFLFAPTLADEMTNVAAIAAVHESGSDAVDASSSGTRVPWMWALLRLPRYKGAKPRALITINTNRVRNN